MNIYAGTGIRRTVGYKYKEQWYKIGICMSKYKERWKKTPRKHESEIEI
jgi:hypothetical protein